MLVPLHELKLTFHFEMPYIETKLDKRSAWMAVGQMRTLIFRIRLKSAAFRDIDVVDLKIIKKFHKFGME